MSETVVREQPTRDGRWMFREWWTPEWHGTITCNICLEVYDTAEPFDADDHVCSVVIA